MQYLVINTKTHDILGKFTSEQEAKSLAYENNKLTNKYPPPYQVVSLLSDSSEENHKPITNMDFVYEPLSYAQEKVFIKSSFSLPERLPVLHIKRCYYIKAYDCTRRELLETVSPVELISISHLEGNSSSILAFSLPQGGVFHTSIPALYFAREA